MANNVSSFSLSHAGILDGATAAEVADVYGVNTGSLELESDTYERTGDDKILSTIRWITKGTLSLSSPYMPLDTMAILYGTPVVSGTGDNDMTMQLWTEKGMNIKPRPVVLEAPGETEDGTPITMRFVLYKVKFGQVSFDQFLSYKEGLSITLEGDALLSDVDELGEAFEDDLGARIGKIVTVDLS